MKLCVNKPLSPNTKIIDFRKREDFEDEHLQNAINIWRTDIEDTSLPYKGMMATKEQIEKLFSKLGIAATDTLVVYDDNGLCDASRLWWVLKNYGFESVKLLNGGLKALKEAKGNFTKDVAKHKETNFVFPQKSNFKLYINKDSLFTIIQNHANVVLLDTRTTDEFSGKRKKKDAFDGGRLPDSKHFDWVNAIHYNGNQKFKEFLELKKLIKSNGINKDDFIVTYCHSGVRSAHTTFVLTELLGFKNVKNYDGSWVEWSYYNNLPKQKDSITTITE